MQARYFANSFTKATPAFSTQQALTSANLRLPATTVTPAPQQRTYFRRSEQRSINKKKDQKTVHPRERSPGMITPTKRQIEQLEDKPELNRVIESEIP